MLGKLLKHEFSQTGRTLLPIFGGAVATLLLAKLMTVINGSANGVILRESGTQTTMDIVVNVVSGIAFMLFVIMLMALMFGTMLVIMHRFYRMLGDEGYVMFALPVTPAQHIWAKTISGITWMLGAVAYCIIAVMFLMWGYAEAATSATFFWEQGGKGVLTMTMLFLCIVCGLCAVMWQTYLACTLGARFGQHRLVASIVAFFVLQMAIQIIGVISAVCIVMTTQKSSMGVLFLTLSNANPFDVVNVFMAIGLGILLVVSTVYYFVMHYNLSKKLNLA